MSAKQRHKQKVMKRLTGKLEDLGMAEKALHSILREHVAKAENKCKDLMKTNDVSYFLQQYCRIEQELDGVFNFVEQLTSSAEDMIENAELHEVPYEDMFSCDRVLSTSTPIPSIDKDETLTFLKGDEQHPEIHSKVTDHKVIGQTVTVHKVTEKVTDNVIKKELTEMIQNSGRRRRPSSEAAIQTEAVFEVKEGKPDSRCKVTESAEVKMGQKQIDIEKVQTTENVDSKFNERCTSSQNAEGENVKKECGKPEKSSITSEVTSAGRTKSGDVVPRRVKKQLLKTSNQVLHDSGSSQVDSEIFGENMALTSSPKGKGKVSKSKKSPKKKSRGSNAERKESQSSRDTSKSVSSVVDIDNEGDGKGTGETGKCSSLELDISETDSKQIKTESSEISSEATRPSSEQSIPKHEITEVIVTSDTNNSSSSLDSKQISLRTEQVVLYTKHSSSVSQKCQSYSNKSESVKSSVGDPVAENVNAASDDLKKKPECEELTVNVGNKDVVSTTLVDKDYCGDSLVSPGSLLPGRITPVVVSEVISPWCFFLQQNGPQLNQLMENICMYMAQGGLNEPALLEPEIGCLCLARYSKDNAFYRAYVMETYRAMQKHSSEVEVLYVDYGNRERVKVTQLRRLPEKFKALPTQAICCALAEVMPCNKYCVWAEDDIHMFRQYVTNQQLSCTPPTCRSSNSSHPLLVELMVSLPVPTGLHGGIYLNQCNIANLLIKNNKAQHIEVTEQLGLLITSREGAEEAAILSHNTSVMGRLAIKELTDSQCEPTVDAKNASIHHLKGGNLGQTSKAEVTVSENLPSVEIDRPDAGPKVVQSEQTLNQGTEVASKDDTNSDCKLKQEISISDEKSKHTSSDHISPRSENSDTESQRDERQKGKNANKGPESTCPVSGSAGHLDRITEEHTDLDSVEIASTSNSQVSEFPGKDLPDFHLDFDNLYLNPQGQEVMLAHVKSPKEFYVHIISQKYAETLDRLMKTLNGLFESANRRKLTRISKTFDVEVNKLCCAQFLQDNSFYRGIIRSTTPDNDIMKGRVLVHYIDFGDEEWLPRRRIFPLPQQFSNVPRLAVKCSLAYIKPVSEAGTQGGWSEKSVETFVKIAGLEKTLHMHVVQGSLDDLKKEDPCEALPALGIMLVDSTGTEEVCINMDLIQKGVAQLDAEHAKDNAGDQSPDSKLELWNPMEEDFLSKRNSYNIDIDDAGVATTGYKAKDEERICKFYSMGKDCWRGDRCPYRHIVVESGVTYDKEPVYAISDNQADILPHSGSWVAMEIATILSPSHFYTILPLGNKSLDTTHSESESAHCEPSSEETLDDLLQALDAEYSSCPQHQGNLLLRAIGEVVVARFHIDKCWYRARVIEVTEEKVKVFFVDFGNTEWISENDVMDIKPQFLHLPFQAIECFMSMEPKEGENWTQDARLAFRELVDGKTLVGHIKTRSWNGCLWVELYDTATETDVNIGEELVKEGYAKKAETQDSHTDYTASSVSFPSGDVILVPG